MIPLKSEKEIEILKEGGKRHKEILDTLSSGNLIGVSTNELNDKAMRLIKKIGGEPAFLNYQPEGSNRPYPAALCVSINDDIVHGIPNENIKVIKDGDIVSLDLGLRYKGLITDSAVTVGAGKISRKAKDLMDITKKALFAGIMQAKDGNTIGDIGYAIEGFVKGGNGNFSLAKGLAGHGVGYRVHEEPFIPNYGSSGHGLKLKVGMVFAIEPMVNAGKGDISLDKDGFTYKTRDGSISAHFEHTVAISSRGTIVLTNL